MTNDDISWLSEPHTHDLFMRFPLPLALVDGDGCLKLLNKAYTNSFEGNCLTPDSLRRILHDPYDHSHVPVPMQCDGGATPVFVRTVNVAGSAILVFEKSADIAYRTELAELHRRILELEKLSSTDRLTGAWNRAHFDRTFSAELSRSVRYRQPLSLIFFDIDHFKQVNDTYGHAAGDKVLCELVSSVQGIIRAADMLFRWGGEEFVILAPSTSYRSAAILAEKLRANIEQHRIESVGNITISLGVAEHVSGESENVYFQRADTALYAAKNAGRNRIVVSERGSSDIWEAEQETAILRLTWHESYDCGEPTIDQEHRRLFELANALIDSAFKRSADPQVFEEALDRLIAHVAKHFADEEAVLAEHRYPGLAIQALAHKRLVERALQLRDAAMAGGVTIGELVDFLATDVVARHMLITDREFYPLFGRSASAPAD